MLRSKKSIADKQLVLSAKEVDKSLTLQAKSANDAAAATDNMRATSGLNNADYNGKQPTCF